MVSQASELVFLPQELLKSSPHLVVKRRGSFLQLSPINTSHVDNLNDIYITVFGPAFAKHLLLSLLLVNVRRVERRLLHL